MSKTASIALGLGVVSLGVATYIAVRPVQPHFIRVRDNQRNEVKLNNQNIRWVAKYNGAYYVCARPDGCLMAPNVTDKFIVDPAEEPKSYAFLSHL